MFNDSDIKRLSGRPRDNMEQCIIMLQTNIDSIFNGTDINRLSEYPKGIWYYYYFADIINEKTNIKHEAIIIYINTMIRLYSEPYDIKYNMFVAFGCTHYKILHYGKYLPTTFNSIKKQVKPEIKKGIITSIIGTKCILLLLVINDWIIN